mgnify:CR=1 FL=1
MVQPAAPKAVSKAKAPKGKTPLDAMIEAGDKLGIDGNAADEPMRTVNQEYQPSGEPVSNAQTRKPATAWTGNGAPIDDDTGKPLRRERIELLLAHQINLFAYHLPLDAHPQLGNNAQLGNRLGFTPDARFGDQDLGFIGAPHKNFLEGAVAGQTGAGSAPADSGESMWMRADMRPAVCPSATRACRADTPSIGGEQHLGQRHRGAVAVGHDGPHWSAGACRAAGR